jgi:chaperonin cofactor prefoldin
MSSSSSSSSKLSAAELQKRKEQLDKELKAIEKQIYDLEESYIGLIVPSLLLFT